MQKMTICLAVWFIGTFHLLACDVCGSASSGQFLGILKDAPENFLSISYHQSLFETRHPPNLFGEEYIPLTEETFRSIQLSGKYRLSQRINAQAIVPFGYYKQTGFNTRQQGLGDIQLQLNYLVSDHVFPNSFNTFIAVIGAGISIPTGSYDVLQNNETINPNLQLGTGSVDFIFLAQATYRMGNSGLNAGVTYRLNSENKDGYRFGNKINSAVRYFYLFTGNNLSHAPIAGLAIEYSDKSTTLGQPISITGGHMLLLETGYEFWMRNFNFGISLMLPLNQELSEGLVSNKYQFSTKFIYFL